MADEKLKMNSFEVGLNPNITKRTYVHQHTSYMDVHNIMVSVERIMKEKNDYYNEQRGTKRKGDQRENFYFKVRIRVLQGTTIIPTMHMEASNPTIGLG